jgi:hypothetical protein
MWCEGKKIKTLGRRYPKAVLPHVSYPLSTKAFPAKMLGCEGKIKKTFEKRRLIEKWRLVRPYGLPVRSGRTRSPKPSDNGRHRLHPITY